MHAYVINIMVVLIIFPVILQTIIIVIMLSIGRLNILYFVSLSLQFFFQF